MVNAAKILGVIISSDLKWGQNSDYITTKAMKRIWTLRRLRKLGMSDDFLINVYKEEIRPLLEYAVQVCNGALTKRDSYKIEKVKKVVLRLLQGKNYSSYTEACEQFGLEKLFVRREKLCVKFCEKEFKNSKLDFSKN